MYRLLSDGALCGAHALFFCMYFRSRTLPSENNNAFHDIYVANVTVRETSATLRLHDFPSRSDVEWSRSLAHNKLTPESLPVDLFLGVPRLEVL